MQHVEFTERANFWINEFKFYNTISIEQQYILRSNIYAMFKTFWDEKPDQELFCRCICGLVLTPNMVYYIQANTIKENQTEIHLHI